MSGYTEVAVKPLTLRPMKLLRTFPPLQARPVISITLALAKDIPEDVYAELIAHPVA